MSAASALANAPSTPSLDLTLRALRPLLADPDVTELCINRPGETFIERQGTTAPGWQRQALPFADLDWCWRFAKLVAHATRQRIDEETALLAASLPDGERVQIVVPPACEPGTVSITIRRPAERLWSLEELDEQGIFRRTRTATAQQAAHDPLAQRLATNDLPGFFRDAVRARKNILVSGATGSGKTTFTKSLMREIPASERLITIEDAPELRLDGHPNHVRLFYSKDGQGLAKVTTRRLLEACLRMRPDRILLAELRGEEAFDFLRNVCSGHPGSITSIHAASCTLAFEQLVLLVKQSAAGRELPRSDIQALVAPLVDVVVQCALDGGRRVISEVWYAPLHRRMTFDAVPSA